MIRMRGHNRDPVAVVLIVVFLMILVVGCANRATPPGGPRDRQPPQIVEDKSTLNFQTNLVPESIELTFDEWVTLQDPLTQILISPPLAKQPEYKLRGKTLVIDLDVEESLRDNTTYTINLGKSIQDITEKNVLQENTFIFSTGPVIDSLSVSGTVVDAITREPVNGVRVMLYESEEDSVVYHERPYYASVTREDGTFTIQNIKKGNYKAVALNDQNLNYLYNPFTEEIGFLDHRLHVSPDTVATARFLISTESIPLMVEEANTALPGYLEIKFNREPGPLIWQFDPNATLRFEEKEGEVMRFWFDRDTSLAPPVFIWRDTATGVNDTITFDPYRKQQRQEWQLAAIQIPVVKTGDPLRLCFASVIRDHNPSLILINGNPLSENDVAVVDSLPLCVTIVYPWSRDSNYRVQILPGAMVSNYGVENDTIETPIRVVSKEDFGTFDFNITGLFPAYNYIFNIVRNENRVKTHLVRQKPEALWRSVTLEPGTYKLEVVEDRNKNGRWDPAIYMTGTQPEKIIVYELEQLRANWDVEVDVHWNVHE